MEHKLIVGEVRIRKGISQNELAKRCEISQGYLSEIEKNIKSPTFRMLSRIATALEVCPKLLIKCTYRNCNICEETDAF